MAYGAFNLKLNGCLCCEWSYSDHARFVAFSNVGYQSGNQDPLP